MGSSAARLASLPANGFAKDNILGTVSQVGGVPTGAVIERGSNANGEYVKLADGTLICRATVANFYAAANGNTVVTVTMPATFVGDFSISGTGSPSTNIDVYGFIYATKPNGSSANLVYKNGVLAQTINAVSYMAIGRWF